jgi:hypothetical protein
VISEHDVVALSVDLPEHGLRAGDPRTVVLIRRGGEAYEVEFMTLDGETIAVATLLASQVRPIEEREIAHARKIIAV